ncbi:ribosyldihydronicotinamide dehydrogenase [quinone]-like isoform 1-T1 [Hipposideros larvatus]
MAGKKVLIVYAHQEPRSFNGSLKKVAVDELSKQGCTVTVSDLYAMDFEPRATRKDITVPTLLVQHASHPEGLDGQGAVPGLRLRPPRILGFRFSQAWCIALLWI